MKSKKDVLVLDVVDLLLNTHSGIKKYLDSKGVDSSHLSNVSMDKPLKLSEMFGVESQEEALSLYSEYCDSDFVGALEPLSSGVKRILKELSYRYELYLLMSFTRSKLKMALRKQNIIDVFGDIFSGYHFVESTESKKEALQLIMDIPGNKIAAFIDSNPVYVKEALELDVDAFLFAPKAKDESIDCIKVRDWSHIEEIFLL